MENEVRSSIPKNEKLICGIVMPISSLDGCPESHWAEVKSIIFEAIISAGFEPNLVSDSDESGVIQKRIIENLYNNHIVICDVSGKNPNVMFELGIRLTFDKPTIVIKDDKTSYSFDTSPIEHLGYQRDLRYQNIVDFKDKLANKILTTYKKSTEDSNYSTFLKHFGDFRVPVIDTKEVSAQEYLLDELREIKNQISKVTNARNRSIRPNNDEIIARNYIYLCIRNSNLVDAEEVARITSTNEKIKDIAFEDAPENHHHLYCRLNNPVTPKDVDTIYFDASVILRKSAAKVSIYFDQEPIHRNS